VHQVRGQVLHCGRFGCMVRLEDGRFGVLPASEQGLEVVRRAIASGRHPSFPFIIAQESGRHLRLALCREPLSPASSGEPAGERLSTSLEQKIIDFWRQVSEWDRNAGRVDTDETAHKRTERFLPFEERAPRQYRDIVRPPRKGPKSTRRNRP
jgi:hypothetical protein